MSDVSSDFKSAIARYTAGEFLEPCDEKMVAAWKRGIKRAKRVNKGPKKSTIELIHRAARLHILGDEAHPAGYPDYKTLAEGLGISYQRLRDIKYEYAQIWADAYAQLIPEASADVGHIVAVARLTALKEIAKRTAKAPEVIEEVMLDKTEPGLTRKEAAKDLLGMVGISEKAQSAQVELSKAAIDGMRAAIDSLGIVVTTQATGRKPESIETEIVEESK